MWRFASLGALLAACGEPAPVPLDRFTDAVDQSSCLFETRCGLMPDLETCLASTSSASRAWYRQAIDAVGLGRAQYDAAWAAECLDKYERRACVVDVDDPYSRPPCWTAFEGTIEDGSPCATDPECESGHCWRVVGDPFGACGRHPEAMAGDSCAEADCVGGSWCDCNAGMCVLPARHGETCQPDCARDFACLDLVDRCDSVVRRCVTRPAIGEACDPNDWDECALDSYCCRTGETHCVPGVCAPRAGAGGRCESTGECLGDLVCGGTGAHRCMLRPASG